MFTRFFANHRIWLIAVCFVLSVGGILWFLLPSHAAWFDTSWTKRIKLSVNPAQVPSTQTDFVAYLDLSLLPSSFFSSVQSDGSDIVVTSSDETTQIPHELVSLNTTGNTGEMHIKIPSVSGTVATDLYLYYGNASASNSSSVNTWSEYQGVWHLDEPAASTSSTGMGVVSQSGMDGVNGGWAVLYGATPVTDTQISTAIDEDIINDSERNHTSEQLFYWAFNTSSAVDILNDSSTIIGEVAIIPSVGSTSSTYTFRNTYTNPVIVTSNVLASDSDTPVVVRIDSLSTTQAQVYLQSPGAQATPTAADVHVIVMETGAHTLPGGTKVEAGSVNVTGVNDDGDWTSSEMVQLTPTNSYGTPVVLGQVMTDNDPLWSVFWSSNGTQSNPANSSNIYLGRNVAEDTNTTRAAEDIGYIVLEAGTGFIGSVSWAADISSDSVAGVGDSPPYNFSLGGGALSGAFSDSTINQFNTNFSGTVTGENTGAIGNAVFASGNTDSRLPIGGLVYTNTNNLDELTASLWLRTTDTARSGILDFDRSEHWEIGMNFHNAGGASGQISFDTANSADGIKDLNSGTTVNDDSWHHVVVVYDRNDATDKKIYIDGVLAASADQHTTGLGKGTARFGFMADGSEANVFNGSVNNLLYEGYLDEVRIRHSAKSADAILTEYNNQSNNASFWTVSAEESVNFAPTSPTTLYFNHTNAQSGLSNPIDVTVYGTSSRTPYFSALYNDPDAGDIANMARIQVSTDPTFASVTHWDSGWASITNVTQSNRSSDIEYDNFGAAATLPLAMDDGNITYYWRIAFQDDGGEQGVFSSPNSFSLLDLPNMPMGLAATKVSGSPDTFSLGWLDASTNEDTFELERRDNTGGGFGSYTAITGSPFAANTTSTNDTTTVNNAEYQYRIRACNYAGCSNPYESDPFSHFTEPEAPDNVTADYVSDSEFTVNFIDRSILNAVTIDRCDGMTNCNADTFGNVVTQSASVQDASENRTDNTGLAIDNVYRWRVQADNGVTTSQYTYSGFEYTKPDAPSALSAVYQTDTAILVSWTDNSEYEDGFRVYVSMNGGGYTEVTPGVNTVGANTTSYLYTSAVANSTYQFQVYAHIGATVQNASLLSTAGTTGTAKTAPSTPTGFSATYNADNDIALVWTDNASNEDEYEVLVSQNGGSYTSASTLAADATAYTYTTASANSTYTFIVRAVVNTSAPENPADLESPSTASNPILYTTATAPALASSGVGPSTINWSITDNAAFEIGVGIFESDGSTEVTTLAASNVTAWTEVGLSPNVQYTRTAKAYVVNDGVQYFSAASSAASVYTLANNPGDVEVTAVGSDIVDITWTTNSNPGGTEFRAQNLTTAEDSGWTTGTTWQNTGLECNTSYDFLVSSRNGDSVESPAEIVSYTTICGGGGVFIQRTFPTELFYEIQGGETCSANNEISVDLGAMHASAFRIGLSPDFEENEWLPFNGNQTTTYVLPEFSDIYPIYVQFKSPQDTYSTTLRKVIELDLEFECVRFDQDPPTDSQMNPIEDIQEEPFVKQPTQEELQDIVSSYSIDLILPDGVRREMVSNFAQIELINNAQRKVYFEDSGSDMDFNDVVILMKDLEHELYGDVYTFTIDLLDASLHHEVVFIYNGVEHVIFYDTQSSSFTAIFSLDEERFVHEPNYYLVKTQDHEQVYLLDMLTSTRRVFMNKVSFLSHGYRFDKVQVWQRSRLFSSEFIGGIFPKSGSVLIKTTLNPTVYYLSENSEDFYAPELQAIPDEQLATILFTENWNEYVIDLDPSIFSMLFIAEPLQLGDSVFQPQQFDL